MLRVPFKIFGGGGIFPSAISLEIMFIFRWVETEKGDLKPIEICYLFFFLQDFGMGPVGHLFFGECSMDYFW